MSDENDNAPAAARVHRLVDMVVEEVSLVDRAANKHRFLVVKRDAQMSDKNDDKPKGAGGGDKGDVDAGAGPKGKPKKKPDAGRGKAEKADTQDAIATATAILERLTSAIEILGEASDDDATELLTELSSELAEAASEIAEAAGVADAEEEESEKRMGVADAVAKVRAMLGEVSKLASAVTTGAATSSAPPTPATPPPAPAPTAPPSTPSTPTETGHVVAKQLEAMGAALEAINVAIKDQGARLGRIEKGTPLPNSRAHDERPRTKSDAEVTWPLDLNRPLDRDSVAKGESFHDR